MPPDSVSLLCVCVHTCVCQKVCLCVCTCIIRMQLVVVIWRNLVLRNGGRITDMLDLSCLAKVTDGYTPGHMNTAVTQVLNERRIAQVKKLNCLLIQLFYSIV